MKINVMDNMVDYEGNVVHEAGPKSAPEILRRYFLNAVNSLPPGEVATAEVLNKAYQLSIKLCASKEVDLTVDERSFILERIQKTYNSALIYGRVKDLFEGIGPSDPNPEGTTPDEQTEQEAPAAA